MKTKRTTTLVNHLGLLSCLLLASCGNYQMTTPMTASQEVSKMSGFPALSGKPALRTPANIGVITTGRTDALDFASVSGDIKAGGSIRSIQPIDAFIPGREYHQLSDVLAKRAKLIHDTRFLGLDVILVCDQETRRDRSPSLLGVATLGILDAGFRKQDSQLTVLCMDARTGYVYGVMGRQENGHAPRLALFHADVFGNADRSHVAQTTRREAVRHFPQFWAEVAAKYGRGR